MLTRTELVDRVKGGGFDYLDDDLVASFVEEAVSELWMFSTWPFRRTETTAAASTFAAGTANMGKIVQVRVPGESPLNPMRETELQQANLDLTLAGTPQSYYYRASTTPGADTAEKLSVHTFPVAQGDLTVVYLGGDCWDTGDDDAASGADRPRLPDDFLSAIIQRGRMKCKEYTDGWEDYGILQQVHAGRLEELLEQFSWRDEDEPDFVHVSEQY